MKRKLLLEKTRKYVWRRSHETFMPQCLGQYGDQDRQSAVSVLFWGCITYKGVGKLVPVEGNMNSEKYINVLDECLWPVVTKHFPTIVGHYRRTTRHVMSPYGPPSGKETTTFPLFLRHHRALISIS